MIPARLEPKQEYAISQMDYWIITGLIKPLQMMKHNEIIKYSPGNERYFPQHLRVPCDSQTIAH